MGGCPDTDIDPKSECSQSFHGQEEMFLKVPKGVD